MSETIGKGVGACIGWLAAWHIADRLCFWFIYFNFDDQIKISIHLRGNTAAQQSWAPQKKRRKPNVIKILCDSWWNDDEMK